MGNSKRNISFKCPYCEKRFSREDLVIHVDKKHDDMIPENYTAFRVVFDYINKKPIGYNGKCIICGNESGWDEAKGKYNRICTNPECKRKYIEKFEKNMINSKGVKRISSTIEGQTKMLANRKISGKYKFSDGVERTYTGSYEKKTLEFMDKVLECKGEDVITPGPIMEYIYENKKHIYISDIYYAPYNLIIEVKDGGSNPNNRPMDDYRKKQVAKEEYIIKNTDFNYLRLTDNNFGQLMSIFAELKLQMSNDNNERVIRINEGFISNKLENPYKYGENKKINEELVDKINSTNYPWYFINVYDYDATGLNGRSSEIILYGYDEEPINGIDKSDSISHKLYSRKVNNRFFSGKQNFNPAIRKFLKFNKGAAKNKDIVLLESSFIPYKKVLITKELIKKSSNFVDEAMNALLTGYIPGSVDNPDNTYIVNYMQNNVFSGYGVSDNIKLTNLIIRNNKGLLSNVDETFLYDKQYNVYILNKSVEEVSNLLKDYMGKEVDENFIYETLIGHKLYTYDQIIFEESLKFVTKYETYMDEFRQICEDYFGNIIHDPVEYNKDNGTISIYNIQENGLSELTAFSTTYFNKVIDKPFSVLDNLKYSIINN